MNNNGNGVGKTSEFLQYDFTELELRDFSKELARQTVERTRLEQRKKEVDSQLKSQIEATNTQIAILASNISTGHESRMIDCAIFFHGPSMGRATICRKDTGEVVRERAMSSDEMQERLPFEREPEPQPESDRRPVIALIQGEVQEAEFTDVEPVA